MWIIRVALSRPYTFLVLAIVILLFGPLAILRTPIDIFPNIRLPVVSIVWQYTGLPPDEMSDRIITYFERSMTTAVNDIDHIESQSLPGLGVIKVFFHPHVQIAAALAQVTSTAQTVLKNMPPGLTRPQMILYNASSVPILQLALWSKTLSDQQLFDLSNNFIRPQLAQVEGAAVTTPYGGKARLVMVDIDPNALRAKNLSAADVTNAILAQNPILPSGTAKVGMFAYNVKLNASPKALEELNDLPVKTVDGATIYLRDVGHVRDDYSPQQNVVRVDGRKSVLTTIQKNGAVSTLDIIARIKALLPGSYVDVHFQMPARAGALRLPVSARLFRQHGLKVATLGPDNKVVLKSVELGRDFGTEVEVLAGLSGADRVIDNPTDGLSEGDTVRVVAGAGP